MPAKVDDRSFASFARAAAQEPWAAAASGRSRAGAARRAAGSGARRGAAGAGGAGPLASASPARGRLRPRRAMVFAAAASPPAARDRSSVSYTHLTLPTKA